MSKTSLPNIEIAIWGALERGEKRDKAIRAFRRTRIPFTYEPLRKSLNDVLRTVGSLGLEMPPVSWHSIEKTLIDRCTRSTDEKTYNSAKAKALYDFREQCDIQFRHHQISSSLILPNDSRITFWSDIIAIIDGRPLLPFFDLRSASGLQSERSQQIALSIQLRFAIEQDADLDQGGAEPAIIRVPGSKKDGFTVQLIDSFHKPFLSMDEIQNIVLEVWDDLIRISREDQAPEKRTGTGGLFDLI